MDGTRKNTIKVATELQEMASEKTDNAPFIALINKSDLKDQWEIEENDIKALKDKGWKCVETSAKDEDGLFKCFFGNIPL